MRSNSHTRRPAHRRLIAAVGAVAILAGACGSDGDAADAPELASIDEPTATTPSTPDDSSEAEAPGEVDPEQAFAEFEACMADHGVSVAFGGTGGAPVEDLDTRPDQLVEVTPEDIEAAQEDCNRILDNAFGSFDLSPEQEAEQADELLGMQQCMADAGFDIDASGGGFQVPEDVDFDEFNIAMNDCAPEGSVRDGS